MCFCYMHGCGLIVSLLLLLLLLMLMFIAYRDELAKVKGQK